MQSLIKNLKVIIKNNYVVLVVGLVVFLLGVILGFFAFNDTVTSLYNDYALNFYTLALSGSSIKFMFTRIGNLILLFIPVIILSFNPFTIYLNLILVFYKGLVLTISFKCLFLVLSFNGLVVFLILSLIQSVLTVLSILLFIVLAISNKCNNKSVYLNNLIKITLVCLSVALIGITIEFLLLITVVRPFNFYF